MRPYFYKIKEISTGKYYVGCQYGAKSDPNNLLKTYCTSNKYVKSKSANEFEIIYILERSDARDYERKYLKRVYSILGREKFLKIMINRNLSPGILLTTEIIAKANVKRRISNSRAAKKLWKEGRHNFQLHSCATMPHVAKLRSERMMGNKLGSLRKITDEYRKRQADDARGNTNVRGTIWVINSTGTKKRVQPNSIPEGYVRCKKNVN